MIGPSLVILAASLQGAPPAPAASAPTPMVCRLDAFTPAQRERHRLLSEKLAEAFAGARELPGGYELSFDLSRLRDAQGQPYCVVELAEWVDLESRCCPFLSFAIELEPKGKTVRLRLTGAKGAKAVLASELGLLEKGN